MSPDKVNEVYYERIYSRRVQQDLRDRIHWMCAQAKGKAILDVGCSQGILSILLAREGYQVAGIDLDPEAVEYAQKEREKESPDTQARLEFRNTSVFDCDFEADSFDTVILGEIIEHLANPERLIEVAVRWTRPGGTVVITTPFGALEDPDHKRTFYLRSFFELVDPALATREIVVIGKRICFAGEPRKGEAKPSDDASRNDLLRLSEQAFADAEAAYLAEIRQMHEHLQVQTGNLDQARNEQAALRRDAEQAKKIATELKNKLTSSETAFKEERRDLQQRLEVQRGALDQAAEREVGTQEEIAALKHLLSGLRSQREEIRAALSRKEAWIEKLTREQEEAEKLREKLTEYESLVSQKERYIQHLKKEVREANLSAQRYYQWGSQHLASVRYQLGHALLRAARPSRDTLALPWRVARILARGLRDKGRKGELGGLGGRIARVATRAVRGERASGQEGSAQVTPGTGGTGASTGSGSPTVTVQESALDQVPPQHARWALDLLEWKRPASPADVRVCAVMDEFSATCFRPECSLVQPRPDNWESVAAYEHPHLLFVESAWKGNQGAWQYRVAKYANPPGRELADMVERFRREGLPTVFWNKEDPVHYDQFVDAARRFDVIFTSDENQVARYRSVTRHDRVEALAFAAQPRQHNPVAPGEPRGRRVCFAGSYYANRFQERREEMEMLLDAAVPFGLDIYDRNHGLTGPGSEDFRFPQRFEPHIRGRLSYQETLRAYKGYRAFLNVNSVIDSPTMFSRRVFELLACGTPVVSTRSRGIEEMLGSEAVWLVRDRKEAAEAIEALLQDDSEWLRRSLAGIRLVFAQHTYHKRFQQVLRLAGVPVEPRPDPVVMFLARAGDGAELERVQSQFESQTYPRAHLSILCPAEIAGRVKQGERIHAVADAGSSGSLQLGDLLTGTGAGLIGLLSGGCVYGRHYAEDLVWAHTYSGAPVVGKALADEGWYRYNQPVHPNGCLFDFETLRTHGVEASEFLDRARPADWIRAGVQAFCADGMNFVADFAAAGDEDQLARTREACEV